MSERQERALHDLTENGWTVIENMEFADLLKFCEDLGARRRVKQLVARPKRQAAGPSLSANHGLGQFPPHTDGASDANPPRYVALWSSARHEAATLLYDGEDPSLDCPLFSQAWLAGVGRRRFYVVPRQADGDRVRWRFNPDCMRPTSAGSSLEQTFARFDALPKTRVEWRPQQALILDNIRMLHGREALAMLDERELMRVSIAQ